MYSTRYTAIIIIQSFQFSQKQIVQLTCTLRGHLKIYTYQFKTQLAVHTSMHDNRWTKRTCLHAYIRDTRTGTLDFTHPSILFECTSNAIPAKNPRLDLQCTLRSTTARAGAHHMYNTSCTCTWYQHTASVCKTVDGMPSTLNYSSFNKNVRAHFTKKIDATKEASYVWNTLEVFISRSSGSKKLHTAFKITKHKKHDILVLQCESISAEL